MIWVFLICTWKWYRIEPSAVVFIRCKCFCKAILQQVMVSCFIVNVQPWFGRDHSVIYPFGGIKQWKCMVIFRDFSKKMCILWVGNSSWPLLGGKIRILTPCVNGNLRLPPPCQPRLLRGYYAFRRWLDTPSAENMTGFLGYIVEWGKIFRASCFLVLGDFFSDPSPSMKSHGFPIFNDS